jgi:prepilin-type processing-associated H-X9-DG protein
MDSWIFFGIVVAGIGSLFGLAAWAFGGGALLMVGGRYIVKSPKATYWRSVGTIVLAGLASGMILTLASTVSFALLGPVGIVGALAGAAAGLLVTWLIIKAMFAVSFGKAILAWLPTLALAVIALPIVGLLAGLLVPAIQQAQERVNQTKCMVNLRSVGTSMVLYKLEVTGNRSFPADLDAIVKKGYVTPKQLTCPCLRSDNRPVGRKYDYFYFPRSPAGNQAIVACDFGGNHRDGSRNVLYVDGSVHIMSADTFQAELADPANAAFAAALAQAEVSAGRTRNGGD